MYDIDIKRLRLDKGDGLVITAPGPITPEDAGRIIGAIAEQLDQLGHGSVPILFLSDGVTISVLPASSTSLQTGGVALL